MTMHEDDASGFPVITTTRLILRALTLTDIPQLIALRCDDEVNKYIYRAKTTSSDEAVAFINKITTAVKAGESYYWVISTKTNNELIGTVCMWNIDKENLTAEIGYELMPAHQGIGLMHETITAVIDYAFNNLGFKTIFAYTHRANQKSIEILKKFNFIGIDQTDAGDNEIAFSLANKKARS